MKFWTHQQADGKRIMGSGVWPGATAAESLDQWAVGSTSAGAAVYHRTGSVSGAYDAAMADGSGREPRVAADPVELNLTWEVSPYVPAAPSHVLPHPDLFAGEPE